MLFLFDCFTSIKKKSNSKIDSRANTLKLDLLGSYKEREREHFTQIGIWLEEEFLETEIQNTNTYKKKLLF